MSLVATITYLIFKVTERIGQRKWQTNLLKLLQNFRLINNVNVYSAYCHDGTVSMYVSTEKLNFLRVNTSK